jgi:hypothetical protein
MLVKRSWWIGSRSLLGVRGGLALLFCLALLLIPAAMAQAGMLDQDNSGPPTGSRGLPPEQWQIFRAGITGQLDQVDVLYSGSGGDLTIKIETVVNGQPSGNAISTTTASLPSQSSATWGSVQLNQVSIDRGTEYAIVLDMSGSMNWFYNFGGYGEPSSIGSNTAFEFKTYVEPPANNLPTTTVTCNQVSCGGWFAPGVVVVLSAVDNNNVGGAGIHAIYYTTDGSPVSTSSTVYTGPFTLSASATVNYLTVDNEGNSASGSQLVQVDGAAPATTITVTPSTPPDGSNGWYTATPTIGITATDSGGSGLAETCANVVGASNAPLAFPFGTCSSDPTNLLPTVSEGTNFIYAASQDNAGNVESTESKEVDVDTQHPTISGSASPVPNSNGWNNTNVAVSFTCLDPTPGSGVPTANCGPNVTLSSEGAGQSVTGWATDVAGNVSVNPATVSGINIDKTPPNISISSPADGATYTIGQSVTASYGCPDSLSGTALCAGSLANGSPINTSTQGDYSFTVNATDKAGNQSTKTVHYSVRYRICLLYNPSQPIKQSGSTIPIKLFLCNANGTNVSSSSLKLAATGLSENPKFGASGPFTYSPGIYGAPGSYQFNLKTTGLRSGSYHLTFTVNGVGFYLAPFMIKT